MEEMSKHGSIGLASMRAGMDRKTGRKYVAEGQLPSEMVTERDWRTREDPFEEHWAEVEVRLEETAANLIEHVLPRVALRQWVLTFPFQWRRRLAQDGELLGVLSRIFVSTVQAFYGEKTGAMTVVQRTSSDLRLNSCS
ncbi:hypothetical protein BH09MYX1_BH09MYX1_58110 [soil metagenome]